MELLPVVCLCLLTRCGITSADGNEPVVVPVEEDRDALLPCSLSTKENIEQGHFDWNKLAQNNEKQKEVFRYLNGRHSNTGFGSQDDGFKGRVSHFQEELKHGNASIIIRNTRVTDSGEYTCTFTEPRKTFHIKVVVDCVLKDRTPEKKTGACPKPNLKILGSTKDGVLLQCEVQGASPKPKVEWRDSSGKILPVEEPQVIERGGLYDIILQTTVTKMGNYSCVSTQEEICHQISADTHVPVHGPIVISVYKGDAAPLPCSLSTEENIESEMFEWKKDGQKVFLYDKGTINGRSGQSEEFKGRVSHYPHKLKRGDASITIRNTKVTDSGNYTCDFPRLQPRQTFHIELEVVETGNSSSGANSSDSTGVIVGIVLALVVVIPATAVITFCITRNCNKGS